ncbi:MAG: hypothetical protein AABX77_03410 [Nanoarchaeota archaeon]
MAEIFIKIPDELKEEAEEFNIDLSNLFSELVKRELLKQKLLKQLDSKEEQDLIKWSVELGRKAKKGRFKRLFSKLSIKEKKELLEMMPPEKRQKYQ